MNNCLLKVYVDQGLKHKVKALASSKGESEAKTVRDIISSVFTDEYCASLPAVAVADRVATHQMTLRLPAFLLDDVKSRAAKKEMSLSRYVAALVQTHLRRSPVMTANELQVLAESNRELIATGRNLNQIAYALNAALRREGVIPFDNLNPEVINLVRAEVLENRRLIRALTRASLNAWEDVDGND